MARKRSMVNLKDIAQETRLSVGTVSRVLNNRGRVSSETRSLVERVARKLDYRPNLLMHGIRTGKTKTIGVIMPGDEWFYTQMYAGVHDVLMQKDYVGFLIWPLPRTVSVELDLIHRLIEQRVDGIIIRSCFGSITEEKLAEVWQNHVPVVAVDHELPLTHADFVGIDDEAAARMAAEHLLSLGHRRLGHLAGSSVSSTGILRRTGFEEEVAKVSQATCVTVLSEGFEPDVEPALELLQKDPRPTAVFAANDVLAECVYKAAAKLNLRVPDDVSVVGFSDLDIAPYLNPPLTTIHHYPREIGRAAAKQVLLRTEEGTTEETMPWKARLTPKFVLRKSTAPLKNDSQ